MPVKNDFLETGVIVWHWAVVTGEELLQSNNAIYEHKFEDKFKFQLLDTTRITELKVTTKEIERLAKTDAAMTVDQPQVAVIVAETDFIYGMGRMWTALAESDTFETAVVRTMGEAIEYLQKKGIHIEEPFFRAEESP